ncbi:MAG: alpha-galactosidase [Anaerolineaceae bacterium]|nr:alpha-galactosidase [Anaerolineaceae bacterium]
MNSLHTIQTTHYQIDLFTEASPFTYQSEVKMLPSGREQITLRMSAETAARPPQIELRWSVPQIDIHNKWHPAAGHDRSIRPDWAREGFDCKSSRNAPVYCLLREDWENRLTFALSDALNHTWLGAGVSEERGEIECLARLFTATTAPMREYEVMLVLDERAKPYYSVLEDIANWWAGLDGYAPGAVPEHARLPMYSTWYSFHQALDPAAVEAQCALAKSMGMEAVIVDDGWQTADNARGYAYCGDWEVTPEKFPDFKAHVDRVHEIGMKYVLWFSVPFVGKFSKACQRFEGKFLNPTSSRYDWFILDPRFPEVRAYLIELYRSFITDYGIDGFKLDFIDAFDLYPETAEVTGGGRDYDSVPEAVDRLLMDVLAVLRALNPDVLIEFRQRYVGPLMRKYGNMLRVGDVPNDFLGNRIGMVDVRLLAGNTAVHSDMVMWNPRDSVESAAMQIVHTLFAVPQISVMLDQIPEDHQKMVNFYLGLWRKHRDVLLDGAFKPEDPASLYPVVQAATREKRIAACFAGRIVDIREAVPETVLVVNGTMNDELLVNFTEDPGARKLEVWDCTGALLQEAEVDLYAEPYLIAVPPAGVLSLTELKE